MLWNRNTSPFHMLPIPAQSLPSAALPLHLLRGLPPLLPVAVATARGQLHSQQGCQGPGLGAHRVGDPMRTALRRRALPGDEEERQVPHPHSDYELKALDLVYHLSVILVG